MLFFRVSTNKENQYVIIIWNYENGRTQSDSYHPRISMDERRTMTTVLTMSQKEQGGGGKLLILVSEKKKQITSKLSFWNYQECHMIG